MSKSEFARRQLKKHGWKEGSGLGKDEHGRADAIKVSLKMDKAGVGHDPGKEFTDHWWLRVFNETAQKIGKKGKKNDVDMPKSEEEEKQSKMAERRKNFYKGFVQSTTLTNGVEEKTISSESSDEDEKESNNTVSVPTLEDIHKFCGGATGHKAASFGIRMEGKIKRASHHEKQFEEKAKRSALDDDIVNGSVENIDSLDSSTKKRKKKKKKEMEDKDPEALNTNKSDLSDGKKSRKRKPVDETVEEETLNVEAPPSKKSKKKKKDKKEKKTLESVIQDTNDHCEDPANGASVNNDQEDSATTTKEKNGDVENSNEIETKSCKKKKKKRKNQE
ncbi:hypothetical protein EGW08_010591 [Elysia chlorotica]|uniref:G patch domain-containing protein 4 n=1 Tax=Elysia chlorotica TaxID=188477 RepID=A0A433TJ84_ELYCH|nr:hypothetical protein EGW08_010591 [Elysia chlorotica]